MDLESEPIKAKSFDADDDDDVDAILGKFIDDEEATAKDSKQEETLEEKNTQDKDTDDGKRTVSGFLCIFLIVLNVLKLDS